MSRTSQRFVSEQSRAMKPSGIRRFFDIAATMDDVVTLGIGEPGFATPAHITAAGVESLHAGHTGYTGNSGLLALRQAISAHLARLYALRYDPASEVLVTVGVSEALFLAMKAVLDHGDEVLIVEPYFVAHTASVEMAGGVPVPVPTDPADDFQVTRAALESRVTPRSKALLISYPNNPSGAVLDAAHMAEVVAFAQAHDLVVISDEIYERLTYGVPHNSVTAQPGMRERTIYLSGVSKSYAMTGWRIGYAAAPAPLMDAMAKVHQYLIMSAPTPSQYAALEAITYGEDDVAAMRAQYDQRRRLIVDGFNGMGLPTFEPRGAFYAFPDVRGTGFSDTDFCELLLQEERVAVIPGSAFGESGRGHVRASYTSSLENIERALERMTRFVQRHGVQVPA